MYRGLQDGRCRNPHRKTSTPGPATTRPTPAHNTYTLKCEESKSPSDSRWHFLSPRSSSSMPRRCPEGKKGSTATPMSEEIAAMARPTSEVG